MRTLCPLQVILINNSIFGNGQVFGKRRGSWPSTSFPITWVIGALQVKCVWMALSDWFLSLFFLFSEWLDRFMFDIEYAERHHSRRHVHSAILPTYPPHSKPLATSDANSGKWHRQIIETKTGMKLNTTFISIDGMVTDWLTVSSAHLLGQQFQLSLGAPLAIFHSANQTGHSTFLFDVL